METIVLAVLGLILSGQAALWYKMGRVEQVVKDHLGNDLHHKKGA